MSPYPKTNVPLCGNIARWRWPLCSALLALSLPLPAQEAPAADSSVEDAEEIIQLSPFEVTAEDSDGYSASTTLAGTRVRTDLRDIAASISVVTAEFLEDTGSHNNQGLLVYTTGTEVGGLFGNFSGVSAGQGPSESKNLVEPSSNTRVRGLSSADNTRDYFQSDVPWDSYNVERVDLQRGPNSILFGVGSPSGIINNTTTPAIFKDTGKIQFEIDQESSLRSMFNVNQELIDNTWAGSERLNQSSWKSTGGSKVPPAVGALPFGENYQMTVFVYEFQVPANEESARLVVSSEQGGQGLTAQQHLVAAGLWDELTK